jgi:succinate dehydrogenase/fumarate reductase cytochrome b subunit
VSHLRDDDLVLHYYGEDGADAVATGRHLRTCTPCAAAYAALVRTLDAVTPPEVVEVVDDVQTLRKMLRERLSSRPPEVTAPLIALVWLIPLLQPLLVQALAGSGQLAREHWLGVPLVVMTFAAACAGPFVAGVTLSRVTLAFERMPARLFAVGAMLSAATPALYPLIARVRPGWQWWYLPIALAPLVSLVRWPATSRSKARVLIVHRLSAAVITLFAFTHIGNQAVALVSESSYAAALTFLRTGYHQPFVEWLLLTSAAIQVFTGGAMGMKKVRPGAWTDNLQAISGWYLAVFLVTHVFASMLINPGVPPAPAAVIASTQFNLLATARGAASMPFLLLGVVAFLYHIGTHARLAALAYLAEAQVRKLSYAAVFVGTSVVVTLGLALCGVHVIR